MSESPLLVGVGGALSGAGVVMAMLAIAYEPFLLIAALPIGAAGYLIWYQGTGRLARRVRARARRADGGRRAERGRGQGTAANEGRRERGGPFTEGRGRAGRTRTRATTDPGGSGRGRAASGAGRQRAGRGATGPGGAEYGPGGYGPGAVRADGPTTEEAYRRLDLSPGSDAEAIREAYREKVKEVHPDAGGTEEEFKRVTEAFETLDERVG